MIEKMEGRNGKDGRGRGEQVVEGQWIMESNHTTLCVTVRLYLLIPQSTLIEATGDLMFRKSHIWHTEQIIFHTKDKQQKTEGGRTFTVWSSDALITLSNVLNTAELTTLSKKLRIWWRSGMSKWEVYRSNTLVKRLRLKEKYRKWTKKSEHDIS